MDRVHRGAVVAKRGNRQVEVMETVVEEMITD